MPRLAAVAAPAAASHGSLDDVPKLRRRLVLLVVYGLLQHLLQLLQRHIGVVQRAVQAVAAAAVASHPAPAAAAAFLAEVTAVLKACACTGWLGRRRRRPPGAPAEGPETPATGGNELRHVWVAAAAGGGSWRELAQAASIHLAAVVNWDGCNCMGACSSTSQGENGGAESLVSGAVQAIERGLQQLRMYRIYDWEH